MVPSKLTLLTSGGRDKGEVCPAMRKPPRGCKERDGYYYGNHFFKILVGDFHERLIIPKNFVQHFHRTPEGTVTLESRSGHTFDVEITNELGKLIFLTGWKEFVCAHDLKMGDFLVFKYDGYSQFKVLIFDPSACEKVLHYPPEKNDGERSRETIDISRSCSDEAPMKSLASKRKALKQRDGGFFSSSGNVKSHAVPRYFHPNRFCLTGVQKKNLNKKISTIHSGLPIYVCVIRKSQISGRTQCLVISGEFAGVYLPFEDQNVVLCRHSKRWEVRCCVQKQGIYTYKKLTTGWKQFARDNNLQLGDLCLFELAGNEKYTINVHIIPEK